VQGWYDAAFERDMGATAPDFRRCLPEAFEPFVTRFDPAVDETVDQAGQAAARGRAAEQAATVALSTGTAHIAWRQLEPRSIGLLASLPRLYVRFDFGATDEAERQKVMKRFDLVMLRGGG
jgi:hypothetical protein